MHHPSASPAKDMDPPVATNKTPPRNSRWHLQAQASDRRQTHYSDPYYTIGSSSAETTNQCPRGEIHRPPRPAVGMEGVSIGTGRVKWHVLNARRPTRFPRESCYPIRRRVSARNYRFPRGARRRGNQRRENKPRRKVRGEGWNSAGNSMFPESRRNL